MELIIKPEYLDTLIETPRLKNYVMRFVPTHLYQHVYSYFPHLFIVVEPTEYGVDKSQDLVIKKSKKKKNDTPTI